MKCGICGSTMVLGYGNHRCIHNCSQGFITERYIEGRLQYFQKRHSEALKSVEHFETIVNRLKARLDITDTEQN